MSLPVREPSTTLAPVPVPTADVVPFTGPAARRVFGGGVPSPGHVLVGAGLHLLFADLPAGAAKPRLLVDGKPARPPFSLLTLQLDRLQPDRGRRAVCLVPLDATLGSRSLSLAPADATVPAHATEAAGPFAAQPLLDGLAPPERLRLVRMFLDFGRSSALVRGDPGFARSCRTLVEALAAGPVPVVARFALTSDLVYLEGVVSERFGRVLDAALLTADAVLRLGRKPEVATAVDRQGRLPLRLVLDRAECRAGGLLVLLGEGGLALRTVAGAGGQLPTLLQRATSKGGLPGPVRDLAARVLRAAGGGDPTAAATLRELHLLAPLPKRQIVETATPLGCAVDLAVPVPGGGLFVAGWLHDPKALTAGLRFHTPFGPPRDLPSSPVRFARDDVTALFKLPPGSEPGFAAFLPGPATDGDVAQVRAELVLRSGTALPLAPPPRPVDPAEARAAVLGSLPPAAVTPTVLAQVLAPAIRALHAACLADRGDPEVLAFGTPVAAPAVSIVVPLYKVLEFLRFQLAAFARDPDFAAAELIFVLDSPEQRAEVAHLLAGLHLLYGLPCRLLVQPRNLGYAAANNAAAAVARGHDLLFLNSDVVPDRPGWLGVLRRALADDPTLGAVGPKLLFDDDSLQHAGLFFDRDPTGRWYNHHFFKGMPRDLPEAQLARDVPGVTGACLLVKAALFQAVGGFCEDYVIGDFEDSDLSLRIRAAGHGIRYIPAAELYHLERRSISRHTGYTRGVASLYNGWLHAQRWAEQMAGLMVLDWVAPAWVAPDSVALPAGRAP